MRCLLLIKLEAFSLQLYYQPDYFTGKIPVFFRTSNLKDTYSGKHLLVAAPFYVICETRKPSRKPLKIRTNKK